MFQNLHVPLGFKMKKEQVSTQMAIEGHKSPVVGTVDLVLQLNKVCYRINVLVIEDLIFDFILGNSLNLKAAIDLKNIKYQIDGETLPLREQHDLTFELKPRSDSVILRENGDRRIGELLLFSILPGLNFLMKLNSVTIVAFHVLLVCPLIVLCLGLLLLRRLKNV